MDSIPLHRLVLVGEANPYGAAPRYALYDEPAQSAGARLRRKLLGVHRRTYFGERVVRLNLCPRAWNRAQAQDRARQILQEHAADVVVMLGRKVAEAFLLLDMPPFSTRQLIGGPLMVSLAHPSGLCREWSKPGSVERARGAIRGACPWFPVGEADAATDGEEDVSK